MTFSLSLRERLARARSDLKAGIPIAVKSAGETTVALSVETLDPEKLSLFKALPNHSLAITDWRAKALSLGAYDTDLTRITPHHGAPLNWYQAMADPARDLDHPMKGPFNVARDGDPMPARIAIRLSKQAGLLPCVLTAQAEASDIDGLTTIDADEARKELLETPEIMQVSQAPVPLKFSKDAHVHVFRTEDGSEHYAIAIGNIHQGEDALAVRLHSACFTGDLIGSLKCDCGAQLNTALAEMGRINRGVLLYLNQEGRGIGLANKMRAYSLQHIGFDTVEANHRLGFEDDERNFQIGAELLKTLGVTKIKLMTNNPAKIDRMQAAGITVTERIPLKVGETEENKSYLETKAKRSGHLL